MFCSSLCAAPRLCDWCAEGHTLLRVTGHSGAGHLQHSQRRPPPWLGRHSRNTCRPPPWLTSTVSSTSVSKRPSAWNVPAVFVRRKPSLMVIGSWQRGYKEVHDAWANDGLLNILTQDFEQTSPRPWLLRHHQPVISLLL